jgi:hypothetical protein
MPCSECALLRSTILTTSSSKSAADCKVGWGFNRLSGFFDHNHSCSSSFCFLQRSGLPHSTAAEWRAGPQAAFCTTPHQSHPSPVSRNRSLLILAERRKVQQQAGPLGPRRLGNPQGSCCLAVESLHWRQGRSGNRAWTRNARQEGLFLRDISSAPGYGSALPGIYYSPYFTLI